jgi:hypothetical protein
MEYTQDKSIAMGKSMAEKKCKLFYTCATKWPSDEAKDNLDHSAVTLNPSAEVQSKLIITNWLHRVRSVSYSLCTRARLGRGIWIGLRE